MATDVEYESRIPRIAVELPHHAHNAEEEVAREIAAEAKRRAPRLNRVIVYAGGFARYPGQLADSIEVQPHSDEEQTAVAVGAFWGLFLEQGTEHMEAEPFLQPAAIAHEPDLVVTLRKAVARAVK